MQRPSMEISRFLWICRCPLHNVSLKNDAYLILDEASLRRFSGCRRTPRLKSSSPGDFAFPILMNVCLRCGVKRRAQHSRPAVAGGVWRRSKGLARLSCRSIRRQDLLCLSVYILTAQIRGAHLHVRLNIQIDCCQGGGRRAMQYFAIKGKAGAMARAVP